jgi:cytochrome P450
MPDVKSRVGSVEPRPVRYAELGCWVVTDPATVKAALRERRLSSASLARCLDLYMSDAARARNGLLEEVLTRWLVQRDGAEHAASRKRLTTALSPARVRALEPEIARIVDDALDRLAAAGRPDAMAEVADVIPARVMGHLLGLRTVDVATLYRWTRALSSFLDAVYRPGAAEEARQALTEMCDELAAASASASASASAGFWERLTDDDHRLATGSMMLFGGLETTASLLGSALHHVLADPGAAQAVRDGGTAEARRVTEHVLRAHPPLSHVARIAGTDVEIGGERIARGDFVLLSLTGHDVISGGDPAPDTDGHSLAFGHGAHFCLGAALARTEATILLERFCARFPGARLAGPPPSWRANSTYAHLEELCVKLEAMTTQ